MTLEIECVKAQRGKPSMVSGIILPRTMSEETARKETESLFFDLVKDLKKGATLIVKLLRRDKGQEELAEHIWHQNYEK